ncbi:MAG: STAS domain-containing protein, partial [Candidatus Scatosoma sp.]
VFHLTNVTFMDSTGIGFFIGRYKKLAAYSIPAYFTDVGSEADKVLSLSGVYTVVPKLPDKERGRNGTDSGAYQSNGGRKA